MKRIAHRGLSEKYPENTLLAFSKAIEAGADGIETDLRLSLDEEIILFHDKTLKHKKRPYIKPESLSLWELKKLDISEEEQIPTLDALLELADGKITLILEIKYNPKTYKKLCEIMIKKIEGKHDWVEVSCFDDMVLEYVYALDPDIKLHKLIEDADILEDVGMEEAYKYVSYFDVDVRLRDIVLDKGLFERHKVIFWTVDKEDLSKEKEAGLYGIMKNDIKF